MHCGFDSLNHHFLFNCVHQRRIHHKIGCPMILKGEIQEFFVYLHFWCQLELYVCGNSVHLLVRRRSDKKQTSMLCKSSRGICFNSLVWETWSCLHKFVIVCQLVCFLLLFSCYFKAIFFSIFLDTTHQSFVFPRNFWICLNTACIFSANMCLLSAIW